MSEYAVQQRSREIQEVNWEQKCVCISCFLPESLKLLCRVCAVTLGLVQLKLQMHFSYKNTAAELQEGQAEKQTHNMM